MSTPWVVKRTEKANNEWEKRMVQRALKEYRRKHHLVQEQLAAELKVSLVTVSRWERGVSKPSQMALKILRKKGIVA